MLQVGFSINQHKNEKRSRLLNVEDDMRVTLSFLRPNKNEIIKKTSSSNFSLKVFLLLTCN